jgi:hypothetical protein
VPPATFDGAGWTEVTVANPPAARAEPAMATLGNKVVLFGGLDIGDQYRNDTWTFDGTGWTEVTVAKPPMGGSQLVMATLP